MAYSKNAINTAVVNLMVGVVPQLRSAVSHMYLSYKRARVHRRAAFVGTAERATTRTHSVVTSPPPVSYSRSGLEWAPSDDAIVLDECYSGLL